jgi:LSD1 subclass zinc finger protein
MVQAVAPTCPTCGAAVELPAGARSGRCEYCQTEVHLVPAAPPAGPPGGGPTGWGRPGPWPPGGFGAPNPYLVPPPALHPHVAAQMAQQRATQQAQAMKLVIWIIVATVVAPFILVFFFILLGMCAAVAG